MGILSPSRTRVAVLRGGPSPEYDVSLQTGANVLSILREQPERYDPVDIFISKEGEWHVGGLVRKPEIALRNADLVWNAMHGSYGEDGQVQKMLEKLMIPYTGSNSISSAVALHKDMAKRAYESIGLLTPRHEVIREDNLSEEQIVYIFRNYLHPVIVKPASSGSSIGVKLAHTFQELVKAIEEALEHSPRVIVEEFIRGKKASVPVIEDYRDTRFYALIPVEVGDDILAPGNFSLKEKKELENMAKLAHESLSMRHHSVSDFVITPKGKIYILETNANPKMHKDSVLLKALEPVGMKPSEFVDHIVSITLR